MEEFLLDMRHLSTFFFVPEGVVKAVDNVSYHVRKGETLGIVGESGCGKTVSALSILRLIPSPPGKIINSQILFEGEDLLQLSTYQMRKIRGNKISMIFQEPLTSLNPVYSIGNQISESFTLHQGLGGKVALNKSIDILHSCGVPSPERIIKEYPHQLSGGMRQRVMIAMALSCNPRLLIADEPTTALDVTIQAQILDLIIKSKEEKGMAMILITHNLGVIAETAQRVVVIYGGKKLEEASVDAIFERAHHPYTKGLLKSIPRLDNPFQSKEPLWEIPGVVPNLFELPRGCPFYERCSVALGKCVEVDPSLREIEKEHFSACWL